jgi:hypothetical protein
VAIANTETEPALPALHPRMAEVFRRKTEELASALEHQDQDQRASARQALRGLIDQIVIPQAKAPAASYRESGRDVESRYKSECVRGCHLSGSDVHDDTCDLFLGHTGATPPLTRS